MLKITEIFSMPNYKLRVTFENGEDKVCDITPYLDKGVFTELKNEALFKRAVNRGCSVECSVEWPNEIDLSSDTLYLM